MPPPFLPSNFAYVFPFCLPFSPFLPGPNPVPCWIIHWNVKNEQDWVSVLEDLQRSGGRRACVMNCECLCSPVPPKFICWNLTPKVKVLRGGVFGRRLGHGGRALKNGISVFVKDTAGSPSPPPLCEVIAKDVNEPGSGFWTDNKLATALILDFSASRAVTDTCLLVMSHLVYGIFVTIAQMD